MQKDLSYYMGLPYSRIIEEKNDESGHYFYGYIKELSDVRVHPIQEKRYSHHWMRQWKVG